MNNPQYILSMYKLSKVYPGGQQVIKDISLSFLPGAKIGVLGGNGAGKSTLLKIMAGVETEYNGEVKLADGIKVGYLAQEPELKSDLNVYENVMEGMSEAKKLVDDFNTISLKFSEDLTDEEMNETIVKQGELQEQIDSMDAWDLDRKAEIAMDALSLPPADASISHLSGGEKRRVALAQLLLSNPDFLFLDGRLTESYKGSLYNDMFFSMKTKCMVEYAEHSMIELNNNLSNHIGSEQNLYNYITMNDIDYEWLDFLGLIRNDWEINGQTLDVSNYHIC